MSSLQIATTNTIRGSAKRQVSGAGLTARLALDDQTKCDAYAIRHASYLSGGYIDALPDGLFSDADDLKPNSTSIVIYKQERPVASVRLCVLDQLAGVPGWDEIPASRIFPEAVAELAAGTQGGRPTKLTEINRLVRHPDFATDYHLAFVLFRFVSYMMLGTNSDMLSCVRRNHTPFYKRMHFNYVAGPRRYAGVKFETNLMLCPENSIDNIRADMPIVGADEQTIRSYAGLLHGETVNVFMED
jgi:hypothetical protein